ncbi:hypothetical protein F5Y15DRAFT_370023 [Xylariaceae sp. FL0016]|nr:hypothetical protein F5Y15DRAFT_370023 [Xylariaceae sp. FL0016]
MAPNRGKPFVYCEGASSWTPDAYMSDTTLQQRAESSLTKDDLASAIATSFNVRKTDGYVYHAMVSVTLPQVQHVISLGDANGLHGWYRDLTPGAAENTDSNASTTTNSKPQRPKPPPALPPPSPTDIEAYLSIFSPSTSTPSALNSFLANAKKGSLRASIASHLQAKRFIHSSPAHAALDKIKLPKSRSPPPNPYLTYLSWAARALEWAGPCPASAVPYTSHPVLAILYHHFGCVCPSYEALEILRLVADGREILDLGSGNGYWTYMLRAHIAAANPPPSSKSKPKNNKPVSTVTPIDNAQSLWRTTYVSDTLPLDGESYLHSQSGCPSSVLLLVYPIVGGAHSGDAQPGDFTRRMLAAYAGDTLCVVGTQNRNGFTGFPRESMDEYMAREYPAGEWVKVVQAPLPSFPGKDDTLFIFQRGDRAPREDGVEKKESGE